MTAIASLRPDFYRIPLPVALTDSTHGEMTSFELITARVVDGHAIAPDSPGHGVAFDWKALESLRA